MSDESDEPDVSHVPDAPDAPAMPSHGAGDAAGMARVHRHLARLFGLLTMLWVGSQLTIGYAAALVLFWSLDRTTAGSIAAKLFFIEGFLGAVCGVLLLGLCNAFVRSGARAYRHLRWLVVGMLLCVLLGYFALQPFMNAIRVGAMNAGVDVAHFAQAARFNMLHGVSMFFYLIESVLGILLVWLSSALVRGRDDTC
jgi:hypothetical protein